MSSSVSAVNIVEQLPLYISEQPARTDPEEIRLQPLVPKLFFHERQPREGVFSWSDPTRGLEANLEQKRQNMNM